MVHIAVTASGQGSYTPNKGKSSLPVPVQPEVSSGNDALSLRTRAADGRDVRWRLQARPFSSHWASFCFTPQLQVRDCFARIFKFCLVFKIAPGLLVLLSEGWNLSLVCN